MSRIRAASFALLVLHSLALGWMLLRPRAVPWVCPSNLHPFATIRADLAAGPTAALENIGGGLLLLSPLGVLLPIVLGRLSKPLLGTATYTILSGLLITLAFGVLEAGVPGRTVNVDTLILHFTGIALAQLLVYPFVRGRLSRHVATPAARSGPVGPGAGAADRGTGAASRRTGAASRPPAEQGGGTRAVQGAVHTPESFQGRYRSLV
ncbi:VanZ family protein [Streptomyces oceani]|uniref:VanZ family protein n=1 Tax=Streptomyces oceani TaxID=1075402 RepID=UPI001FCD3CDA|nr:VanZ family protein [Streptomyces oceani]